MDLITFRIFSSSSVCVPVARLRRNVLNMLFKSSSFWCFVVDLLSKMLPSSRTVAYVFFVLPLSSSASFIDLFIELIVTEMFRRRLAHEDVFAKAFRRRLAHHEVVTEPDCMIRCCVSRVSVVSLLIPLIRHTPHEVTLCSSCCECAYCCDHFCIRNRYWLKALP